MSPVATPHVAHLQRRPVVLASPSKQTAMSFTEGTLPAHTHARRPCERRPIARCAAVPDRISFPDKEQEILAFWEENDTFQESLKQSKGRPVWSFYDGPPFATGLPHYGHLLAGTIKARRLAATDR